jgi:hypothetical protein
MTNYETPSLSCEQRRLLLTALEQEARARAIWRSLTEWSRHCGFEPALHHRLLIRKLEQVASGEIDRLAVFMPPGSAKSTYSSILFPPWFLSRTPKASVLAASHTTELAEKWGRRVRNLASEHGPMLRLALSSDSQAAGRWALTSGGEYYAAGVGVGIAGFRAALAVIDDPVRSREDADSQTVRDRIWDWYKTDLLTRLRPNGRIVLIQTRWHEDDLAGRILAEMAADGERWHVLSLAAEAEGDDPLGRRPGEWLWDDEYGYARFLAREKATQPRQFSVPPEVFQMLSESNVRRPRLGPAGIVPSDWRFPWGSLAEFWLGQLCVRAVSLTRGGFHISSCVATKVNLRTGLLKYAKTRKSDWQGRVQERPVGQSRRPTQEQAIQGSARGRAQSRRAGRRFARDRAGAVWARPCRQRAGHSRDR